MHVCSALYCTVLYRIVLYCFMHVRLKQNSREFSLQFGEERPILTTSRPQQLAGRRQNKSFNAFGRAGVDMKPRQYKLEKEVGC